MLFKGAALLSLAVVIGLFPVWIVYGVSGIIIIYICVYASLLLMWAASCAICAAFVKKDVPCTKHSRLFGFYADCIIDSIIQLFRVKLHVTGTEYLPNGKFLLVSNHRSSFDPVLEMGVLRGYNAGFIAKQELFNIPVIGGIMHKCFCLPVGRENARDDIKSIISAVNIIKSGEASIGVYPEGKRNKGGGLLPFKPGAFKIAQKANCPVVIAVIRNSELIKRNAPFKRTHVYIDLIGTVAADKAGSARELSERVQAMIEAAL